MKRTSSYSSNITVNAGNMTSPANQECSCELWYANHRSMTMRTASEGGTIVINFELKFLFCGFVR